MFGGEQDSELDNHVSGLPGSVPEGSGFRGSMGEASEGADWGVSAGAAYGPRHEPLARELVEPPWAPSSIEIGRPKHDLGSQAGVGLDPPAPGSSPCRRELHRMCGGWASGWRGQRGFAPGYYAWFHWISMGDSGPSSSLSAGGRGVGPRPPSVLSGKVMFSL